LASRIIDFGGFSNADILAGLDVHPACEILPIMQRKTRASAPDPEPMSCAQIDYRDSSHKEMASNQFIRSQELLKRFRSLWFSQNVTVFCMAMAA
jgi:hypothetical protein